MKEKYKYILNNRFHLEEYAYWCLAGLSLNIIKDSVEKIILDKFHNVIESLKTDFIYPLPQCGCSLRDFIVQQANVTRKNSTNCNNTGF